MALDIARFSTDFFAQLHSADAGADVRAMLGDHAASVIEAELLETYDDATPMPKRPLIARRAGAISGQSYEMRPIMQTWWMYDDLKEGHTRLRLLLPLIERAYPRDAIAFCQTVVANVTREDTDDVLHLRVRTVQFALYTRG